MSDFDPYELMDREDLISLVRNLTTQQGISLVFSGKRAAADIAKKVRPRQTRRLNAFHVGSPEEQAKNMLIEGENLQAMVTLYKYRNQIDLVVTDPPYNTGQYFRYNDRWDEDPNDPELGDLVTKEDGSRHTKWMKAMMPRLQMMKAMLKPEGVLAMCIDENELFHLGMMLDEVFGEENRLAIINWQKSYSPKNSNGHVSTATEYVLVYAKQKDSAATNLLPRTDEMNARYDSPDGDPQLWKNSDATATDIEKTHAALIYAIQHPATGELIYPAEGRCWNFERSKMKTLFEEWGSAYVSKNIKDGKVNALVIKGAPIPGEPTFSLDHPVLIESRKKALEIHEKGNWPKLYFGKTGLSGPAIKRYLNDVKQGVVPLTYWADDDYGEPLRLDAQSWDHEYSGHSQAGVKELSSIVGRGHGFDTVKPLKLIEKIIQIWCPPNGTVLDPYAGSGTTGHAVLDINYKTQSDRKFILIEQGAPENGDKYARTLTWERLKRVIKGERADATGQIVLKENPLGGGFEYRLLTRQIDAKTVLKMKRDELVDVVLTSHWEEERRNSPTLVKIENESYKYLIGKNDRNEGYFIIWESDEVVGRLDLDSYRLILKEGKKANLKPPYHIYARYGIYQSPNVRFYKIPDRILFHLGLNESSDAYNGDEEDMEEVA